MLTKHYAGASMRFPVFKAFAAGLAYIFTQFLTLLRILWLPALLMMAINFALLPTVMEAQLAMLEIDPEADPAAVFETMGPMFKTMGIMYLAAAIFYPMMMAGVLRHVTRGEAPRLPFYLRFGGDEIRIILATIIFFILSTVIYAVGMFGFLAVGLAMSALSGALGAVAMAIGGIAFFLWRNLVHGANVDHLCGGCGRAQARYCTILVADCR